MLEEYDQTGAPHIPKSGTCRARCGMRLTVRIIRHQESLSSFVATKKAAAACDEEGHAENGGGLIAKNNGGWRGAAKRRRPHKIMDRSFRHTFNPANKLPGLFLRFLRFIAANRIMDSELSEAKHET